MKIIEGFNISGKLKAITESGHDHLIIRNGVIMITELSESPNSGITGIDITSCGLVEIQNVMIIAKDLKRKFAYAVRSGYSGDPAKANKRVWISECKFSGFGPAHSAYDLNRDCIASEGGDDLWLKDCVLDGATDAAIDCKTKNLKAIRCDFKNTYRLVRGWGGTTSTLSHCTLDTPGEHLWHYNASAKTNLFNCNFKQPRKVSFDQEPGVIITQSVNPLTDPWFTVIVPGPIPAPPSNTLSQLILMQEKRVEYEAELLKTLREL